MDSWNIISLLCLLVLICTEILFIIIITSLVEPVNSRKMADFKDEILSKTDQKFSGFKLDILIELRQQLKIEDAEALKYELTKGKSKSQ